MPPCPGRALMGPALGQLIRRWAGDPSVYHTTAMGSGQWGSFCTLPHCLGAVGSGNPSIHCLAAKLPPLPTVMVLVELCEHRNVQLCTHMPAVHASACACCAEAAQRRPHTYGSACGSPMSGDQPSSACTCGVPYAVLRASHVQSHLWGSTVLEQWSAAIATLPLRAAYMGLARPGTEFIRQVLSASQKV